MKNLYAILMLAAFLLSCSLIPQVSPTAAPVLETTSAPTNAPTSTPTVPTPTFTITPSLVAFNTKTSTPEITATVIPIESTQTAVVDKSFPSLTPIKFFPNVPIPGFVKVSVSDSIFYKGKDCLPKSVKFSAQVASSSNVTFVVLFVRFKSKQTDATSKWTGLSMQSFFGGVFTYELNPLEMKAVDSFENAWVEYQFVATDSNSLEIGHTDIFSERLTLQNCVPTPAPTETAVVITP